uniref:Uncharacterized protein n=1 Tax=Tanacetum cinerariifolium TaxID=118510 RepID=A0A699GWD4_TANCI|nr:hypothetical protein [Tanacetum cinerariifolium]
MANLLPRLQELATASKSTMMANQVLVLMEKEIDKELKLRVKHRDLYLEQGNTVKKRAKYIEELERYPRLLDNVEAVKTTRVLKHVQQRDMEKDKMLGYGLGARDCVVCRLCCGFDHVFQFKYVDVLPNALQLERSRIKKISYEEHFGFHHLSIQHVSANITIFNLYDLFMF